MEGGGFRQKVWIRACEFRDAKAESIFRRWTGLRPSSMFDTTQARTSLACLTPPSLLYAVLSLLFHDALAGHNTTPSGPSAYAIYVLSSAAILPALSRIDLSHERDALGAFFCLHAPVPGRRPWPHALLRPLTPSLVYSDNTPPSPAAQCAP